MNKTKIEWCDSTVNPVIGCTYGCSYCYARKLNKRFKWIEDFSKPQFRPEQLEKLNSKKPQIIFMNSMSDIADWEDNWIIETFKAMLGNRQHKYLLLTKRMDDFVNKWLQNNRLRNALILLSPYMMIGQSVDTQKTLDNFKISVDFYSIEPILEPIKLSTYGLDYTQWVIIGAETGNRKGKVIPKKEWIDDIVAECDKHNIPVFMKDSLIPIVGEENMRREFPQEFNKGE